MLSKVERITKQVDPHNVVQYTNENGWSTNTHNNMDTYHKNNVKQKKPDTRIHPIWAHS